MKNITRIAKAVLLGLLTAQAADAASPARPAKGWESAAGQETKTVFALTGDAIINRRLSTFRAPGVDDMFGVIRQADVAFTNFETLIHDFTIPGAQQSGGTYMGSPRFITDELAWAGFDLLGLLEKVAACLAFLVPEFTTFGSWFAPPLLLAGLYVQTRQLEGRPLLNWGARQALVGS